MNFKETGFRAFYHNFCILPITENTKSAIADFPDADEANGLLTYGYYDREAGLTLEVIAAVKVSNEGVNLGEPSDEIRSFIRIATVENEDFLYYADENNMLANKCSEIINMFHQYNVNKEIKMTREMTFRLFSFFIFSPMYKFSYLYKMHILIVPRKFILVFNLKYRISTTHSEIR